MLNQVHVLLSEGKKSEAVAYFRETLSSYVNEHFANEEQFMTEIDFPGIDDHKKIHDNYRQSFNDLLPLIETYDDTAFRSALTDAFTWIISHIGRTDRRYAKFYFDQQA
jgi:hemerythrin-like metal-binding protein